MAITLSNDTTKLKIESAGERYIGSRFDWNGTVTDITYKGIPLLGQEKRLFHRNAKIYGRGLHNEFGIKDCIGYDDVPSGGWFPKIGTGWLKKDDKPYFFYTQYELERLSFSNYAESDTKASFSCDSGERNGYAYRYTKTIELNNSGFSISYILDNYGVKPLKTTEYTHNFLQPGHRRTGPHLSLSFDWEFAPEKLLENVRTAGILALHGNTVSVCAVPRKEFFLGGVWQAQIPSANGVQPKAQWTLTDKADNISISESGSFVPCGCDVWGHCASFSPELFCAFCVEPGNIFTWTRTYSITDLDTSKK